LYNTLVIPKIGVFLKCGFLQVLAQPLGLVFKIAALVEFPDPDLLEVDAWREIFSVPFLRKKRKNRKMSQILCRWTLILAGQ